MREPLIAVAIVVTGSAGVYLWVQVLLWSVSRLSGWATLAARYPGTPSAPTPRTRFG